MKRSLSVSDGGNMMILLVTMETHIEQVDHVTELLFNLFLGF